MCVLKAVRCVTLWHRDVPLAVARDLGVSATVVAALAHALKRAIETGQYDIIELRTLDLRQWDLDRLRRGRLLRAREAQEHAVDVVPRLVALVDAVVLFQILDEDAVFPEAERHLRRGGRHVHNWERDAVELASGRVARDGLLDFTLVAGDAAMLMLARIRSSLAPVLDWCGPTPDIDDEAAQSRRDGRPVLAHHAQHEMRHFCVASIGREHGLCNTELANLLGHEHWVALACLDDAGADVVLVECLVVCHTQGAHVDHTRVRVDGRVAEDTAARLCRAQLGLAHLRP